MSSYFMDIIGVNEISKLYNMHSIYIKGVYKC